MTTNTNALEIISEAETLYLFTHDAVNDIDADTTDQRLDELLSEYRAAANDEGYELSSNSKKMLIDLRQTMRDEKRRL